LTLFPALLVVSGRLSPAPRAPTGDRLRADRPGVPSAIGVLCRHPVAVGAGVVAATVLSMWAGRAVTFDANLLHLPARQTESVPWEQYIVEAEQRSSFSALASAASLPALRRKRDAFAALASVSDVDSALRFIPDDQDAKLEILRQLAPAVSSLPIGPVPPIALDGLAERPDALAGR